MFYFFLLLPAKIFIPIYKHKVPLHTSIIRSYLFLFKYFSCFIYISLDVKIYSYCNLYILTSWIYLSLNVVGVQFWRTIDKGIILNTSLTFPNINISSIKQKVGYEHMTYKACIRVSRTLNKEEYLNILHSMYKTNKRKRSNICAHKFLHK